MNWRELFKWRTWDEVWTLKAVGAWALLISTGPIFGVLLADLVMGELTWKSLGALGVVWLGLFSLLVLTRLWAAKPHSNR